MFRQVHFIFGIFINGHNSTAPKWPLKPKQNFKKLLNDLSEIRKVSLNDLKAFLVEDHTSFSVLSLSAKHIQSTERLSISLTKNSAHSFYLNKPKKNSVCPCLTQNQIKTNPNGTYAYCSPTCSLKKWLNLSDNCLTDPQNCLYFNFFNSKEKKLYTRFNDKVEVNFQGQQYLDVAKSIPDNRPHLFITLTFNTTDQDYYAWTTNWDPTDLCWNRLDQKEEWLKTWAQSFDPQAEALKIHLPKLEAEVSQYPIALYYLQLFLRRIRRLWKPDNWKWVVVAELQKNGNWHFHLLSTPIVPYSHKCTLDKNFKPCWNCCTYLSKLWPYGRVNSQSPGEQSISHYLAKYLSKSFHLRQLYQEHGLKEHNKSYRFFKNLYQYETREVSLVGKSKLDKLTSQYLPKNQTVFRHYDYSTQQTSYYYKTNETLTGHCAKPHFIKKNYRLGTRSLNPLNLLNLTKPAKQNLRLKKPPNSSTFIQSAEHFKDFQEYLITNLLLFCQKAEFTHAPLEQTHVSKLKKSCDKEVNSHFQPKPLLHFTFKPETTPLVLAFLNTLDHQANYYDLEESKEFYDARFSDLTESRNAYLNHWQITTDPYRKENRVSQWYWNYEKERPRTGFESSSKEERTTM